jgi:Zn-dependent peptidase ImmA (M78 family)/transcriptional regulator with XRE-family HTH domain
MPMRCDFRKSAASVGRMPTTSDRVRDLIKGSGRTQREIAERIGLDVTKLSKSLSGSRRFSSLDLARIAEHFGVTVDWLITGEEPPLALAARSTGGSARDAVEEAKRLSTLRSDLAGLGFPQPWRAPAVRTGSGTWASQGLKLAGAALTQVRTAGLAVEQGSLPDLVESVFGADVATVKLGAGFDGLATSSDQVKLIVLATSQLPARQRFTLAHELGHLLAGDDQGVHVDQDVWANRSDPSEQRANAFASAFLMPDARLREAVGTTGLDEREFAALATELVVTPSALAIRLKSLRLIDSGTCDRYRSVTASRAATLAGRGAAFGQLVTEASRPRTPGLLARDTYAAYDSGVATLRPYAALLGVDVDSMRSALEIENGAFDAS